MLSGLYRIRSGDFMVPSWYFSCNSLTLSEWSDSSSCLPCWVPVALMGFKRAQFFSVNRFFEDIELQKDKDSTKYRFKKDGKKHTLIIQEATLNDIGMYHAWTNGGHTKGELEVEGTLRIWFYIFFSL